MVEEPHALLLKLLNSLEKINPPSNPIPIANSNLNMEYLLHLTSVETVPSIPNCPMDCSKPLIDVLTKLLHSKKLKWTARINSAEFAWMTTVLNNHLKFNQ